MDSVYWTTYWVTFVALFGVYIKLVLVQFNLKQEKSKMVFLKSRISEYKNWCAYDCPEIGFAMLSIEEDILDIDTFREKLRSGEFTFENYCDVIRGKKQL